jgi:hypothetical protein
MFSGMSEPTPERSHISVRSFSAWDSLKCHTMMHNNIRPCACGAEDCGARVVQLCNLKCHVERNHTEKGVQRKKKKEEQVCKFLRDSGIAHARELRIDFCGDGDEKKCARVDVTIHREDRVVVLEVDEEWHKHYGVGCDVARMANIAAKHFEQEEPILPLHIIRYNPDAYTVNELKRTPKREARHLELARAIDLQVTAPLTITYICYPTTDGVVYAITSPEFPAHLREVCRTVVP